jgi:hypothetical protein
MRFFVLQYPQDFGGPSLLSTPSFLYNYFPNRRGGVAGYGQVLGGSNTNKKIFSLSSALKG